MKTNLICKTAALFLALFTYTGIKAQVNPFPVQNNTSCSFSVQWSLANNNGTPCQFCDGISVPISITSGANNIPWNASCISPCDFKIVVVASGGFGLSTPVSVNITGVSSAIIPATAGCTQRTINIGVTGATIN